MKYLKSRWIELLIIAILLYFAFTGGIFEQSTQKAREQENERLLEAVKTSQKKLFALQGEYDSLKRVDTIFITKRVTLNKRNEADNNRIDDLRSDTAVVHVSRYDSVWREIYLYARSR